MTPKASEKFQVPGHSHPGFLSHSRPCGKQQWASHKDSCAGGRVVLRTLQKSQSQQACSERLPLPGTPDRMQQEEVSS